MIYKYAIQLNQGVNAGYQLNYVVEWDSGLVTQLLGSYGVIANSISIPGDGPGGSENAMLDTIADAIANPALPGSAYSVSSGAIPPDYFSTLAAVTTLLNSTVSSYVNKDSENVMITTVPTNDEDSVLGAPSSSPSPSSSTAVVSQSSGPWSPSDILGWALADAQYQSKLALSPLSLIQYFDSINGTNAASLYGSENPAYVASLPSGSYTPADILGWALADAQYQSKKALSPLGLIQYFDSINGTNAASLYGTEAATPDPAIGDDGGTTPTPVTPTNDVQAQYLSNNALVPSEIIKAYDVANGTNWSGTYGSTATATQIALEQAVVVTGLSGWISTHHAVLLVIALIIALLALK